MVADCCSHDLHMSFNRPSASAGQATPREAPAQARSRSAPGRSGVPSWGVATPRSGIRGKGACLGPAHFDDRGRGRQLVVFESSSVNLVDAKTHHVPHIYVHNKSGPIYARMVPRSRTNCSPRSVNQSGRPPRRSNGSRESVRSYFTSKLAQNLHATNPRNRADRVHRNRPRFSSISSLRHRHRGSSSS